MHPGKPRKWTISGWYPSDPGTGGVYVEGPALEPGESVTVTEQTDDVIAPTQQGATPMPEYTSQGRNILHGDTILAVVPEDLPNAFEQAGILASELNGYIADEKLLEKFGEQIQARNVA